MATIKEVAKEAGVSIATVSRVLNRNYPVSKEAHKRVTSAVKKIGYRPNAVAKSLKINKTFVIGFVVPDISNVYFMEMARGIETMVSPYGYTLTFASTDENPEKEIKLLKVFNERRMDFVVLASSLNEKAPLEELMKEGLRIIMVDTILPDLEVDFVVEDNEVASYRLMKYALAQGHKKVGIVNGIMRISTAVARFEGYKRALEEMGMIYQAEYTVNGGYYRDIAYKNVKKMLEDHRNDLPTLLYATNNQMTEGTMIAMKELGLKIPEDISVVSFGDISLSRLIEPKITVVLQNSRDIGEQAGRILMDRMEHNKDTEQTQTVIIPSKLVVGKSVRHMEKELENEI